MTAFRLAWLELRRFRGHPLRYAALATIVLIPLLYGSLYLWSNWDPYGKLDQVPVAVVNADRPATVDDRPLDAGGQFVDQLAQTSFFEWHFTDADDASDGLKTGRYYFIITVPSDFSANLATLSGTDPTRAHVDMTLNDANGFIAGIAAETVQAELQAQINTAVYTTFATNVFGDLDTVHSGLANAADGAAELADGGSTAAGGSSHLADGLAELETASAQVADGAQEVADGVAEIDAVVRAVTGFAADGLPGLQEGMSGAAGLTDIAVTDTAAVRQLVCDIDTDGADQQAADDVAAACDRLTDLASDVSAIDSAVQDANTAAQQVTAGDLDSAGGRIDDLATGANEVAVGSAQVATGVSDAADGAAELTDGTRSIADGSSELADQLDSAAGQIPSGDPADNAARADVLGNPVGIATTNLHPAEVYGRGMAPFFFAIALWVFGLVAYLLLRSVNRRALASRLSPITTALAGWLPALLLGGAAALVLYTVVDIGLGLDPVNVGGTIGLCLLGIASFCAIAHFLRLALGAVGDVLILVLLIVQLTSAGGLYPTETTPLPFQAIHPLLPMTYLVDGLRITISGGYTPHLWRDIAVLAGFGVAALVGSCLVIAGRRRWTMARMRPAIDV